MAIKPPAWCSRAVPVPHGWKHWATSEVLLPKKFTQEQIDEFWAEKNGTVTVTVTDEVHSTGGETPVYEDVDSITITLEDPSELDSMTKKELEDLGRENGIELDRRQSKKTLVATMKEIVTPK